MASLEAGPFPALLNAADPSPAVPRPAAGATDAARAAADIVLTQPGLSVVIHAIVIARCIFQRVKNFINCERARAGLQGPAAGECGMYMERSPRVKSRGRPGAWSRCTQRVQLGGRPGAPACFRYPAHPSAPCLPSPPLPCAADRIAATLQLLCFFFISVFAFDPQTMYGDYSPCNEKGCCKPNVTDSPGNGNCVTVPSFFQLPVLMLMLITLLNDGTLISVGYDHVIPSPRPEKWNLKGERRRGGRQGEGEGPVEVREPGGRGLLLLAGRVAALCPGWPAGR